MKTSNSLYLALCFPVSFTSVAELTIEELTTPNIDSIYSCSVVFNSGDVNPAKSYCDECDEEIEENLTRYDAKKLRKEMETLGCEVSSWSKEEVPYAGFSIYFDNDVLGLDNLIKKNDDRNYTMGLGFSMAGANQSTGYLARVRNFFDKVPFHFDEKKVTEYIHTTDYGVSAFTPNELEISAPIIGDRPYSSLVFWGNNKLSYLAEEEVAYKSSFVLAALGLDIAKASQREFHNSWGISNQDPLGWDNQISEGGELTFLYSASVHRLVNEGACLNFSCDLSYEYGGSIGYYTNAYAGFTFRFGRILSDFYSINGNPLVNYNQAKRSSFESYAFMGYKARVVVYNVLLQGQFRDSPYTLDSSDINRLVHEANAGYVYQHSEHSKFTYSLNYRSAEFDGFNDISSREHWWGGLYYTYTVAVNN